MDFADATVTILGRLGRLPNRIATAEVERRGGTVRRGISRQTTLVVVGRGSIRQLADGRLPDKLAQAEHIGARCLSENRFLEALELIPPLPEAARDLPLEALAEQAQLDRELVRWLALFDVVQPVDGRCGFRDLVAAREVARLLAEGFSLIEILDVAGRTEGGQGGSHPLAALKVVADERGGVARRIGDAVAELDGQLRLPLPKTANPSVDELFELAEEAEQVGDLATAEAFYRRCVNVDRGDPIAPFNLANVLRQQGRAEDARRYLLLVLKIDPGFADAWYNLALLLEGEGRRADARDCLERAIAADPHYADPLFNLAGLMFDQGDYARAEELWQRYLELDPDSEWSPRARRALALCRRHLQDTG